MQGTSTKNIHLAMLTLALACSALLCLWSAPTHAACADGQQQRTTPPSMMQPPVGSGGMRFLPAVYWAAASGVFTPVVEPAEHGSIVGLWEFEVHATMDEGPFHNGDLIDWGLATWHDDGTEIQFSAGRPYDAGDVCMGVWRPTGPSRYHLNHIALGKDLATGATFDGLTNIRADVTVYRTGNHFSGSYQIIQYTGNPANGTEFDESSVQYQFAGTVTATRVTAN